MGQPGYCGRRAVKAALDSKLTARDDDQVDRAIAGARESINRLTQWAHLDPRAATRYFDWPQRFSRSWVLYLDEHGLLAAPTSLTIGGVAATVADFNLEPVNTGPPYTRLEADRSTTAAFSSGSTPQQAIAIASRWAGVPDARIPAGALAAALVDTTGTTVDVTDGSAVDVGRLLGCGTEDMIVTAMDWLDSGQNLGGNLEARPDGDLVNLTSGAAFHTGEEILIDSEEMLLVGIAGNNGVVKRAWNGSTLAAHTAGADIYARRRLTVERGASGTTAATHSLAAACTLWQPPGLVEALSIAEAMTQVAQEETSYGRTVGSGDNEREAAGKGIEDLRKRVQAAHGRSNGPETF